MFGLFFVGGIRCLEIALELFSQILGADGWVRKEILVGFEARDDFMEQGYNLAFGLGESHNSYLLGLLNYEIRWFDGLARLRFETRDA